MTYFDIYFSTQLGLQIDFPFLQLEIPTYALAIVGLSVVALRVRKVLRDRNRNSFSKVENNFVNEFENDFDVDWTK